MLPPIWGIEKRKHAMKTVRVARISVIAFGLFVVAASATQSAEIASGIPRIVDGDTVQIGSAKIRFAGIDAPETDQVCLDAKGEKWACGVTARDELIKYSAGRSWDCDLVGSDRYGRSLGKCFIEGGDISAWMVRSGWALSFVRYSHDYDRDEEIAREANAGLWAGAFIAPWDWRHRNAATVVLGALSVPVDAQKTLLGAVSSEGAPSPDCTIKASVGHGECIYHLPGDRWYGKMRMDPGKRWFCSVGEAEAAGCRAPKS
ncbi:Endonuclease YncB, thermonuclease family [Bradyrhizobium erythrophlei]|uniref:Endonuclease YncB, thermonuclease family n=2 Tax=Bradyrhizobium erythrophlei TaxID=1437360 RepID=A0A1M5MQ41_9BRAD|nr:Endonuclease YncB, thermonuclease family [Bradyrhizobium erythrophlei]